MADSGRFFLGAHILVAAVLFASAADGVLPGGCVPQILPGGCLEPVRIEEEREPNRLSTRGNIAEAVLLEVLGSDLESSDQTGRPSRHRAVSLTAHPLSVGAVGESAVYVEVREIADFVVRVLAEGDREVDRFEFYEVSPAVYRFFFAHQVKLGGIRRVVLERAGYSVGSLPVTTSMVNYVER